MSFAPFLGVVRRVGLDRPVAIAGYAVPLGVLVAMAGIVLLIGALSVTLIAVSSDAGGTPSAAESAPEPDVLALVAKAETGDRVAIAALAERDADERTAVEWRALGHGYFLIGDLKSGLLIHGDGIRAKKELKTDPIVLSDVRRAVTHPELTEPALLLAARSLGETGADLLYDIWDEQKGIANSTAGKRARALLDEEPAKSQRSPALRAALDLQAALKRPKCSELKKLLPELARAADERSLPALSRLNERRGCGFLGLSDCYSCLRANKDLANALASARSRPRPSFGVPPAVIPSSASSARTVPATAPRKSQ
jgi:hypothetical protein